MKFFLLILALVTIALANRGRQITIWNPTQTTPDTSPVFSFRPTNIVNNVTNNLFIRRDHLFTPALSQDGEYQNPPHCVLGHDMYCNGKFFNFTLDGGQKYWGYDEFQSGANNYADGYGYGYGYDHYDGGWFDIPEKLCNTYPQHHEPPKYSNALNIPSHFQNGENRELYVKLSRFWQNLDNQTPLPADQCYTAYIDVRAPAGTVSVGLATKNMLNGHNHGFGHPMHGNQYSDQFIGVFRDVSTTPVSVGFVSGEFINGTIPDQLVFNSNLVQCGVANCNLPTDFVITVEICNQTTITFEETYPLGVSPSTNFQSSTQTYNIDLRGNGSAPISLDVYIVGHTGTDVFVATAKVVPKTYTSGNDRLIYSTVMDGAQLNPANFNPSLTEVSNIATFSNNQLVFTSSIQYDEFNEPENLDQPSELVCFRVNGLSSGNDYLIDVGVFAESFPPELNGDKSLAVGLRQGNNFVGFNRLGYEHDSLGNVISATVQGNYLTNILRQDHVIQNRPSNGAVQESKITAPHFNVRFNLYGKTGNGISVYAGTPDSPPYTFVWAAAENSQIDFSSNVDLCFYHQAEAAEDIWGPDPTKEWKNITTILNGITFSVENAEFGCDGQDLSGAVVDKCGVCGGKDDCVGCKGIAYAGVLDACGVCDGNNSTCCTNRFGIADSLWDWLLLPHIIDDVSQRLKSLSSQLTTTCSLLDSYSNYCNNDLQIIQAFNDIPLDKLQSDIQDFEGTCLAEFRHSVTDMLKDVSIWVPLNHFGKNL